MEGSIRDYVSDRSKVTYDQLKARFGEPVQVVSAYISEKETDELLDDLRVSKKLVGTVLATAAVVLTMWVGYLVVCYLDLVDSVNGYAVVDVIEVERTEIDEGE